MILSYLYFKMFTKIPSSVFLLFFCFRQYRPTGPADRSLYPGRARLCMSVGRPPGRPTECSYALGFSRSTARRKLCFFLEDGRPSGRPESNGSLPAGQTADRTGRPPSLPAANGSFLFCEILKIYFFGLFCSRFSLIFGDCFLIK